jgi:hypothetical protein
MAKIDKEKGKGILKNTIRKDLRHIDYKRVTSLASKYAGYTIADEDELKKLLRQFTPREDESLFDQRVRLTSLTTPDIVNSMITPMYKIGRTTANERCVWDKKDDSEKNEAELNEVSSKFYGELSVKDYLTTRMVDLDSIDPNSFIIVEFSGKVDPANPETKADPYPFEVNSQEAINYEYINNELQWLIVMIGQSEKFTIYLDDDSIVATRITKEQMVQIKAENPQAEIFFKNEEEKEAGPIFLIEEFNHKAGRVPARRVGTKLDPKTRYRTCVPMIHPAQSYLEKAIKTISEFDLTNALHTFPKIFRYDEICPGNMAKGLVCQSGILTTGEKCPECKGTGWKSQTSTAQEFIVKLPKDPKDMVSLENMLAYKAPPAELLEFQKNLGLYELRQAAIKAVYNSDTYVSDSTAKTATEKNIDLESVYDTLKPFGDNWSGMYKHIIYVCAAYRDLEQGLRVEHAFPKDLKMKSLNILLDDLKKANDSGAPSYVKKSIHRDIAHKMYIDQPDELLKLHVKELFYPFSGKTESEINIILTNQLKSKFDMVLYANFDQIFDELEQEQSLNSINFYKMDFIKQRDLVRKKVEEYKLVIDSEEEAVRAIPFGSDLNKNLDSEKNANV